jgi:hypothetical protein
MMQILADLCDLGDFVCFVLVVIKLFQQKGTVHGILGIICFVYPFVWGWVEAGKLKIQNLMIIWSVMIAGAIIFGALAGELLQFRFK